MNKDWCNFLFPRKSQIHFNTNSWQLDQQEQEEEQEQE